MLLKKCLYFKVKLVLPHRVPYKISAQISMLAFFLLTDIAHKFTNELLHELLLLSRIQEHKVSGELQFPMNELLHELLV